MRRERESERERERQRDRKTEREREREREREEDIKQVNYQRDKERYCKGELSYRQFVQLSVVLSIAPLDTHKGTLGGGV